MCVILRVDYLFAIGLDYAYSRPWHRPFTYSNGRWQQCARQVGPGEVIYLRIAQNYYEILKKNYILPNYSKPKLIYTPTASLLPSLLWTLILCDVTKIWRNKREKKKKKKRKEKRHTKQLCKRRYESTGASEAGGPRLMDPVEPNTPQFFFII